MRYIDVRISQPADERNPMHQYVVDHDDYGVSRLLYRDQYSATEHAAMFHVEGPPEPYVTALEDQETLLDSAWSRCPDDSFYLYVREAMGPDDRTFSAAFSQPGLLVLTPIEYQADGTVRLTAVGPAGAVQSAVDDVPGSMGVDVVSVGEYAAGRIDARIDLTQRQFEAVQAAVRTGYYRALREATLEDVAAELDCSTGTAGDLLRRAERTVMADLVVGGPF